MNIEHLTKDINLPDGFVYPAGFLKILELNIIDIEPWYILDRDQFKDKYEGLQKRFPLIILIPFARRQDNDDVACFGINTGEKVLIIHDYASPGWEQRKIYDTFWDWFRNSIEDMIKFD
jgi:hypothetical protein